MDTDQYPSILGLYRISGQPDIRPFLYPVSGRITGSSIDEIVDIVSNSNYTV